MTRALVLSAFTLLVPTFLAAQSASVGLLKQEAPNPIVAGIDAVYTLEISSEGPDDAANATVNDPLPPGTTFAAISAPAGWSCTTPATGSNGTINCSIALFSPGTATFQITVHTDPALPGGSTISNTATVASTTTDPDPNDNTSTVDTPVESHSDLGISKSGPATVNPGSTLTYTINYTASGPSSDANATITDVLPAGTTFTSINAPGLSCTTPAVGATGTVSCTATSLAAGAAGSITLVVTVDPSVTPGTVIANTASISGDSIDANGANDSSTATATAVALQADLGVTISGTPNPVFPSQPLTYTVGVTNGGPDAATSVTLTVSLSPLVTFSSIVAPAGWSCTTPAVGATGTITCTNPSLALTTDTFTINTTVSPAATGGASIVTVANVSSATTDPVPSNNQAAATNTAAAVVGSNVPTLSNAMLLLMAAALAAVALIKK